MSDCQHGPSLRYDHDGCYACVKARAEAVEVREKTLSDAALELCVAAAEAYILRDATPGMVRLPALVAKVRSLIPGAIDAALAPSQEPR
jgi:hypothetical protein